MIDEQITSKRLEIDHKLDLSDPYIRQRIEAYVKRALGQSWEVCWPLPGESNSGSLIAIDARPGAMSVPLALTVKAHHGHAISSLLREKGLTLVEFLPHEHKFIQAPLDPRVVRLRDSLAAVMKWEDPWALEVAVQWGDRGGLPFPQNVLVLRSEVIEAEKRKGLWLSRINDAQPPMPGYLWQFEQGETPIEVRLMQVKDRLNSIQDYPWDAPVDYAHIPFAINEDGKAMSLGLLEINQLLGGTPGGGKSGGLTALLCGIARLDHTALIGLDPKKVELRPWISRFSRIAKTEADATVVLEALVKEMESRYDWLESKGLKKITPKEMSAERPLLVLVIDELADLVSVGATPEEKKEEAIRSTRIRRLIAKGRAAGVVVIAATQKPQSDVIPTSLRDLIQLRVAYATTNNAMTDTILGAGMSQIGGLAHTIPANQRGVCYIVNETSREPVRARTYWVPDEQVESISKRYASKRVDLPWMPSIETTGPDFAKIGKKAESIEAEESHEEMDF